MPDLREQLRSLLHSRVCLVGVGNVEQGDDGVGVRLAEALNRSEVRNPKSEGNPKLEIRNDDASQSGSRSDPAKVAVGFNPRYEDEEAPTSRSDDRAFPAFNRYSATDAGWRSHGRGLKSTATFGASLRAVAAFERDIQVIIAGTSAERYVSQLSNGDFDAVVFLDAADVGAAPGSVVLLNASEMVARFPQVSTHKLSLGLLAQMIETNGRTRVWLLGVQPESLKPGGELSPRVRATLEALTAVLIEALEARERRESSVTPKDDRARQVDDSAPSALGLLSSALPC